MKGKAVKVIPFNTAVEKGNVRLVRSEYCSTVKGFKILNSCLFQLGKFPSVRDAT
jgi:hypothetical protein